MDQIVDVVYWTIVMSVGMGVFIGATILALSVDGLISQQNEKNRETEEE